MASAQDGAQPADMLGTAKRAAEAAVNVSLLVFSGLTSLLLVCDQGISSLLCSLLCVIASAKKCEAIISTGHAGVWDEVSTHVSSPTRFSGCRSY